MTIFKVVDLNSDAAGRDPQVVEGAINAEEAARKALGADLVRSGSKQNLRARVYYQKPGAAMTMVRLYTKVADAAE
jgi:hypothetical protein